MPVVVIEVNVNVVNGVTATASLAKPSLADVVTELKLDVVEAAGMLIVVNAGLLMLI